MVIVLIALMVGCKSIANYPIDAPSSANIDDRIIGKWKFLEDTDKRNFYDVEKTYQNFSPNEYHVKFWNRGGTNPTYEANIHFSRIGNSLFLNIPYWEGHFENMGYFFLKILDVNADYTKMTTATVYDTTLRSLKNSAEVRERITKNLNNPAFYNDTVHFYKVK